GEARAVGRKRRLFSHRKGEFGGRASVDRDSEEAGGPGGAGHRRAKEDVLALGGPSEGGVPRRLVGATPRKAPPRGNHISVGVPVVLPGKGYQGTIRREARIGFDARARGQPSRFSAIACDGPQIASVYKGYLSLADCGVLQ